MIFTFAISLGVLNIISYYALPDDWQTQDYVTLMEYTTENTLGILELLMAGTMTVLIGALVKGTGDDK